TCLQLALLFSKICDWSDRWLSLNCRSGVSFPAPVPPPSYAPATASQCTVEVYTRVHL
ncbi:hypothetical protein BT67DRAFT_442739, partial [Trichocladium antarcticum]